jgi:hypothetical protein
MKIASETAGIVLVLDDFLPSDEFMLVWNEVQAEPFRFVKDNQRVEDGQPLSGPAYISHRAEGDRFSAAYPTGKAYDLLFRRILDLSDELTPWTGRHGADWSHFFLRSFVYPVGTGLAWHRDDRRNGTAALTFYAHQEWNVKWGGELLVGDATTKEAELPSTRLFSDARRLLGSGFGTSAEDERLLSAGPGQYILPKSNRLVVIPSGVFHCIKKVEAAAGNHVRATVQGVFKRPRNARDPAPASSAVSRG